MTHDATPKRYLALFQGPDTDLFVLAFDGTQDQADELEARLERARQLKLLRTGLVICPLGPICELGAESIHLVLDQVFQDFPPRENTNGPPPTLPTSARTVP
ncbi:hypothetical protein [Ferrovibrio sp.]|uniref:hypothetical protein n=1 Tax=Ferrovibrio sp. TaxID=1917215 RepID=UPI003D0F28F9